VDHTCIPYVYKLEITGYTAVSGELGSSNTSEVSVKNTGTGTITTKLQVTTDSGITTSVSPSSYSLDAGETTEFTVEFEVSNDTTTGDHTGTFKAYKDGDTGVYYNENFVFTVIPTEERESEINETFQVNELVYNELLNSFLSIKNMGFVPSENLTRAETLIGEGNDTIEQIRSAILTGNFIQAEALNTQLNTTLSDLREELDSLQTTQGGAMQQTQLTWAIAIVVVVIAGFIVYMFLPSSSHAGYSFGRKGFKPRKAKPHLSKVLEKAKESAKRVKDIRPDKLKKGGKKKYKFKR
jgi:hypothetical protein